MPGLGEPPEPFVPRRVNHRLHLVLSVSTLGLWAVLVWWWLPLYIRDRNQREYWRYLLRLSRYEAQCRERQEDRRRLERAAYRRTRD